MTYLEEMVAQGKAYDNLPPYDSIRFPRCLWYGWISVEGRYHVAQWLGPADIVSEDEVWDTSGAPPLYVLSKLFLAAGTAEAICELIPLLRAELKEKGLRVKLDKDKRMLELYPICSSFNRFADLDLD